MQSQAASPSAAQSLLVELVGTFTSQTKLAGKGGEDSVVFAVASTFDGSFVAKHPRTLKLDQRAEQLAIDTARALQVPLVLARVHDSFKEADVASVLFNQKLTSLSDVIQQNLFPASIISNLSSERHSFNDRIDALEYLINKKILAQIACIQRGVLPDFDFCNVGYSPKSQTIQLFDFGGIRTGVGISGLTNGSATSLESELSEMSKFDTTTLHNHSDPIAYRAIRLRDCQYIAAAISPQVAAHEPHKCPYAQGVWEKYRYLEAQAQLDRLAIPSNPEYAAGQAQLERLTKMFAPEVTAGAIESINRVCGANLRRVTNAETSGYQLQLLAS